MPTGHRYLMSEQVPVRGLNAQRFWHVGKPLAVQRMHSALQASHGAHGLYLCAVTYADGTCFRLPAPLLGSDYA